MNPTSFVKLVQAEVHSSLVHTLTYRRQLETPVIAYTSFLYAFTKLQYYKPLDSNFSSSNASYREFGTFKSNMLMFSCIN